MIINTHKRVMNNENGVAIIAALLILLLLSILALTSTNTTVTEKGMVRSEATFAKVFSFAESGAFEGVQRMANESLIEELLVAFLQTTSKNKDLVVEADAEKPEDLLTTLDTSGDGIIDGNDTVLTPSEINPAGGRRVVVQQPIESGDSLSLGGSRLYTYYSYGFSDAYGGRSLIRVGFKKRF